MIQASRDLETERLRFRMLRDSDFPTYETWCANIDVMRYTSGRALERIEAWRNMAYLIGHWSLRGYGYYAVEEKSSGQLIGRIGYTNSAGWPGFELGWMIDPAFQGRGFATEGASFLLRYAFEALDQQHVVSLIHADNAPSRMVAGRLGETVEGEVVVLGLACLIHGISRDSWHASNAR
ncbi:MAG: GNAT family N-acetyltransferase [bacterium]